MCKVSEKKKKLYIYIYIYKVSSSMKELLGLSRDNTDDH
jgi:hypothetical protein